MKNILFIPVALSALCLSACDKSDKEVIIASCMEDDATKVYCECTNNAMQEHLSEETYSAFADALRDKGADRDSAMEKLTPAQKLQFLSIFPALITCSTE